MKIAVLSGKGGTGKTLVAVNLAASIPNATYVDCDVEAPNGNLFFKPTIEQTIDVNVPIPQVDKSKCTGCKACVEFCNFNALAYVSNQVMVFDQICHSCGGCKLVCQADAVIEVDKLVGQITQGRSEGIRVLSGQMKVGEASGVPIIKALLEGSKNYEADTIIDCPPGSGCMVMESIQDADYCVLIAEPTEFGSQNLEMVYELVKVFHKPMGVILNKCIDEANPSEVFCKHQGIDILGRIQFDPKLGKINGEGKIVVRHMKEASQMFDQILGTIRKKVLG